MGKQEFKIVAKVTRGNREFIEGKIVGVIDAITGGYSFTDTLFHTKDEIHFSFETTTRNYKKICEILNDLYYDTCEFGF